MLLLLCSQVTHEQTVMKDCVVAHGLSQPRLCKVWPPPSPIEPAGYEPQDAPAHPDALESVPPPLAVTEDASGDDFF